jgi:arylsulfatase A-like enzyme
VRPPYDTRYDPARLTYPTQDPPDARKPAAQRQTAIDMGTWGAPGAELRRALAHYYGMVNLLDDQVARVLDHLERHGRLRDTIVIYTSDHGDYAGEHGMWGKSATLYDCLVRVPLIIAGPDGLLPTGRAFDGMTQSIDVLPTLLTLLGVPVPENVHGLPLQPLWDGSPPARGDDPGRSDFDIAFAQAGAFSPARARTSNVPAGPPASGRHRQLAAMARTAEWKLVYTPGRETQELYDLSADPWELQNRYGDLALAAVAGHLQQRIFDWLLWHT